VLAELHGDNPTRSGLILIYSTGLVGTLAIVIFALLQEIDLSIWQWIALIIVAADVIAGAVANMTKSTNRYYREKSMRVSWGFLAVHIFHPALLAFTGLALWQDMLILYFYTSISGVIVLSQSEQNYQKPLAAGLVMTGIVLNSLIFQPEPLIAWFAPVYMFKLIAAFSVTHYPQPEQES